MQPAMVWRRLLERYSRYDVRLHDKARTHRESMYDFSSHGIYDNTVTYPTIN